MDVAVIEGGDSVLAKVKKAGPLGQGSPAFGGIAGNTAQKEPVASSQSPEWSRLSP